VLNFNHLYYFHVAANEGSLAAAATKLGVTQPTVSEQIRALERALSVTLFERTATGLRLTEPGRLAHEHTSVMFTAGERLVSALGEKPELVPRTLRVGLGEVVARSMAADFLMPLFAIEDCVPSIRSGDSLELIRDVRSGESDLVLTDSMPPDSATRGLEITELPGSPMVVVAPPGLRPSANWEDIGLVHYRTASSSRWKVDQYLDEHGLRPRLVGETDDVLLLVEVAARGGFAAFVPRSVARDAVAAGRLTVLTRVESGRVPIHAIYQDSESAELARRAVEVLMENAQSAEDDDNDG
jgi:LysR family transcriptional regulator, transcriptional activator of nhaA